MPSRRALLTGAFAAGAAGALVGAAGVAGWVVGRGGGPRALTDPHPMGGSPAFPAEPPAGTPPAALWRYDGAVLAGSARPVLHDDRVAVFVDSGAAAIDLDTGEEVWSRPDIVLASDLEWNNVIAGTADGLVAVYDLDGTLKEFDPLTGAVRRTEERYDSLRGAGDGTVGVALHSAIDDGELLLMIVRESGGGTGEGDRYGLAAYDPRLREERWRVFPTGHGVTPHITTWEGTVISLALARDGGIESLGVDPADGSTLWERTLRGLPELERYAVNGDDRLLLVMDGGEVRGFAVDTGEEVWSGQPGTDDSRLIVDWGFLPATEDGGKAAMLLRDGWETVIAFDPERGRELWRTDIGDGEELVENGFPSVVSNGGNLLVGTYSEVILLDAATGARRWRFRYDRGPDFSRTWRADLSVDGLALVWDGTAAFGLPVR